MSSWVNRKNKNPRDFLLQRAARPKISEKMKQSAIMCLLPHQKG
jgi:hypothetical protein